MSKQKNPMSSIIDEMISNIKSQTASTDSPGGGYIPDIITFCESPHYLNILNNPGNPISLYPLQRISLKVLYRGTKGNELLTLTDEEKKLLIDEKMDYVIDKFDSPHLFRECVLVWGRRCLSEESMIFDAKKGTYVEVGDIWDNGTEIVPTCSLNQKTNCFFPTQSELFFNGVKNVYRLETRGGRHLDATSNHPFLTENGWRCLSRLRVDDKIAIPKSEEPIGSPLIWAPVRSISLLGKKRTFDISVQHPHAHNFVANGILSHNSGKDLLSSFIATYEAMRLLEIPGGNPFAYYKLKEGNPIYILTVAGSDPQAKILFNDVKTAVLGSPYFQDKIGDDGKAVDTTSIWLLTPSDRATNKDRMKKGLEPIRGNLVILAGHSNSDTLRGRRTFCLLFDEVASYKTTSGASGGEAIYNSLAPGTNDFRIHYTDEAGNKCDRLDSKIISISSPRGKDGIFYRMYSESFDPVLGAQRFMMRAPTWKVNLQHTRESCRRDFSGMTEQEFAMEFGAEFAGLAGEKFIADEFVDKAINKELGQREVGIRGAFYFAHLDPAATSHNYALVVIHVESYIKQVPIEGTSKMRKEQRKRYVVDHVKVWTPTKDRAIDFEIVDQYIINLAKRFRFAMVSYDTYESRQSMQKLRKNGIPSKITQFRKRYKVEIYRHLENLLICGDIILPGQGPHAKLLELELKNLKRKWTSSGGFSIGPNEEGEVKTDDIADAIAGACGVAMGEIESSYAKPTLAYMPLTRSDPIWKIGQGTYTDSQFKHYDSRFGIGH